MGVISVAALAARRVLAIFLRHTKGVDRLVRGAGRRTMRAIDRGAANSRIGLGSSVLHCSSGPF